MSSATINESEVKFCVEEDTVLCQLSRMHLLYCFLKDKCNQYFKQTSSFYQQFCTLCNPELNKRISTLFCPTNVIAIQDFIRVVEIVNYFSHMGFLQQLLLKTSVFQDGLLCQLVNYLLLSYQMECHIVNL